MTSELARAAQRAHEDCLRLQRELQRLTESLRSAQERAADPGRTPCVSTADAAELFARLAQHVGAYTCLQNLAYPPAGER